VTFASGIDAGAQTIAGGFTSSGLTTVTGGFQTTGVSTFSNVDTATLGVTGVSTFGGNIDFGGNTVAGGFTSSGLSTFSAGAHFKTTAVTVAGGLDSTGTATFASVFTGTLSTTGTSTFNGAVYYSSSQEFASDRRFKHSIQPLRTPLATLIQLNGVSYGLKQNEFPEKRFPSATQFGFIAQDVEEVLPNIVSTHEDGYKSISYISVVPLLVEAVKEQQDIIYDQQARLDKLEKEIYDVRKLLSAPKPLEGAVPPRTSEMDGFVGWAVVMLLCILCILKFVEIAAK